MQDFIYFVTRSMEILEMMRDSSKFANFMSDYSNPLDPELVRLMNLVETAKDTPAAELNFQNLQKYIFNKELGDRKCRVVSSQVKATVTMRVRSGFGVIHGWLRWVWSLRRDGSQ